MIAFSIKAPIKTLVFLSRNTMHHYVYRYPCLEPFYHNITTTRKTSISCTYFISICVQHIKWLTQPIQLVPRQYTSISCTPLISIRLQHIKLPTQPKQLVAAQKNPLFVHISSLYVYNTPSCPLNPNSWFPYRKYPLFVHINVIT